MKKIVIELDEARYRTLVKMVWLGDWIAHATKVGDKDPEMEEVEPLVYSRSSELPGFDLVECVEKFGACCPTRKMEDELYAYVEEYDEDVFWEKLPYKLARRDLLRETGPVARLTDKHRERLSELEEEYEREFERNGLKNLVLKHKLTKE
jgi:hypothetical protein